MGTSTTIKTIDYEIVKAVKESSTLLIDVREPTELINTGTLPASVNIPLSDVENALKDMGELEFRTKYGRSKPTCDTPIIFSCQSGKRSHKAANMAISLGYTNISNYGGGWLDWEAKTKK